jgi:polyvinyl alcohol dehydrogenase (cytochrome)
MERGTMRVQGAKLTSGERRLVAEYLTGKLLDAMVRASEPAGLCKHNEAFSLAPDAPQWNGWGANLANTRMQSAAAAKLSAGDVGKLKLKWAFGFPEGLAAFAQPTIVGGPSVRGKPVRKGLRTGR